jgi:hypothetical protein
MKKFFNKIKINPINKCWEWQGYKDSDGYGYRTVNYKTYIAHRWSYEYYKGPIPKDMLIRHLCHNTSCVNPNHLEIGTHRDNMDDMLNANRQASGIKCARSKLNDIQILEIRNLYPSHTISKIAKLYGVTQSNISAIIRKKTWKHI